MAVQTQIQTRRGSAATWTSTNPTLAAGEIGFESDTNKFKIGTGSTAWVSLPYASNVSPLTTKGDLYTYSTDNARLAVGANGETLVADSSTSTGLRYNPLNALANPVIGGGFDIWQRGTTFTGSNNGFYTADRFFASSGGSFSVSRQATGDTTNLPNIQYCARFGRASGVTTTNPMGFATSIETINSIPYAGKTITISFYARKGANFSGASSQIDWGTATGSGTDQNYLVSWSPIAYNDATAVLTTTWTRYTQTITVAANATQLSIRFGYSGVGTAGAADYFEVTGLQIDLGTYTASTAPSFRRSGGTIQGELAACQRYYYRNTAATNKWILPMCVSATSTTAAVYAFALPVTMRTTPTSLDSSAIQLVDGSAGYAITSLVLSSDSSAAVAYGTVGVASGLTNKAPYSINSTGAAGYVGFSAEL